jgi:hypothetical protein
MRTETVLEKIGKNVIYKRRKKLYKIIYMQKKSVPLTSKIKKCKRKITILKALKISTGQMNTT